MFRAVLSTNDLILDEEWEFVFGRSFLAASPVYTIFFLMSGLQVES